jgi:hypothetical protein
MIIVPEQTTSGTFEEVSLTPEKIGASPSDHTHDASAITTGTLDVARIPVLPSQKQVMASGELFTLTAEQESEIGQGTVVTTSSGLRYVYKGTGDKKATDSYIVLADITPHWASIFAKPTTFAPSAHTHPIAEVTDLQSGLDSKLDKSGGTMTGKLIAAASTTSSKLNIGNQIANTAPDSVENGDVWITGGNRLAYRSGGVNYNSALTTLSNSFNQPQVIDAAAIGQPALRVTQRGVGEALRVEDETSPDSTAFIVSNDGRVGIGVAPDASAAISVDAGGVKFANGTVQTSAVAFDGSGKIAASLLPSFVDDVLEFADLATFPATGETGKLYVALDTSKVYRWSGSAFTEISPSPGSTDSVSEGAVNLYHPAARAAAAAPVQSVNGQTGSVSVTPAGIGAIPSTEKGAASGVATLDASSKLPADQLTNHTHAISQITQLASALNGKADFSNALACLQFTHASLSSGSISPAGTTFAFGLPIDLAPVNPFSAEQRSFVVPFNAQVRAATLRVSVGTLATGEAAGAQVNLLNATTNTVIGSLFSGTPLFSSTITTRDVLLEVPLELTASTRYALQLVLPAFGTNPSAVRVFVDLYFSKTQSTTTYP